jgi:hypothetical protein
MVAQFHFQFDSTPLPLTPLSFSEEGSIGVQGTAEGSFLEGIAAGA